MALALSATCAAAVFGFAVASGATAAKPFNPCSLVTVKQVQTITHLRVLKQTVAPLGPTCIYTFRGSKTEITVAVETRSFSAVARQMKSRKRVSVHSREGYCGRLGLPTLSVSLPKTRVLTIVAGCTVAQKLAAIALGRLHV